MFLYPFTVYNGYNSEIKCKFYYKNNDFQGTISQKVNGTLIRLHCCPSVKTIYLEIAWRYHAEINKNNQF